VAVLKGVAASDVAESVGVANLLSGETAALVARYQGDARNINFYYGGITRTGDTYTAGIYLNNNGVSTLLASKPLAPSQFSGTGTIQFEATGTTLRLIVNDGSNSPVLVALADANISTPGTIGLWGTVGSNFSNYSAHALFPKTASISPSFTDSFAATPDGQLSSYWSNATGDFARGGAGDMVGFSSIISNMAVLNGVNLVDVSVQADINVPAGQYAGLITRYGPTGMYFGALVSFGSTYVGQIYVNQGGVWSLLASSGALGTVGQGTLLFRTAGSSLQLYWQPNGATGSSLVTSATNSAIASGSVGMRAGQGAALANFTATALSVAAPQTTTLPCSDAFVNSVGNIDLAGVWTQRAAPFIVQNQQATAVNAAGVSLATLNTAPAGDVTVQADVTLAAAGATAGLIARYAGPDQNNYYLATIYNNNGVYQAYIFLRTNTFVQLAVADLTGFSGTGTLRFEVVGNELKLFVNNVLQAVAYNSTLTAAGTVGMRGYLSSFDNFNATAITTQTASLPDQDAFTGANGADLNRVWTERAGAFTIQNNQATDAGSQAGSASLATLNAAPADDVVVQVDVTLAAAGSTAGLVARYSGPDQNNYYLGTIYNNNGVYQAYIFLRTGTFIQLAERDLPGFAGTGTLRFEVVGKELKLFVNNVLQAVAYDSTLSQPGLVGLRGYAASHDNFSASAVSAMSAGLPYADAFSKPDNSELDPVWRERAGAFSIQNNSADASNLAGVSLATLNSVAKADVSVQVNVGLQAAGSSAGVVARYSGPDQSNFYVGMIFNNAGIYQAYIFLNENGSFIQLGMQTLPGFSGTGALRFDVIGSSLKLFVNGVQTVSATDSTLATGLVGIRAANASLDDFSAG
jgi:hypothetical protein